MDDIKINQIYISNLFINVASVTSMELNINIDIGCHSQIMIIRIQWI